MKKILILLIILLMNTASAATLETEQLICALSSTAAYNDDAGELSRRFFLSHGWKLDKLGSPSEKINVKMHVMSFDQTKIFFVTGTEDIKDIEIDLRIKPVQFHTDDALKVHGGFRDYADAALSEGILEFLVEYIDNHPAENFYLTGHSLGGAISILIAARLADAGADMSRIKVITFGAPAVGNKAFADFYSGKINLTRAVMDSDLIDAALKVFGYAHFGEVVNFKQIEKMHNSHSMAGYLDIALRNFYDAGLKIESKEKISTPIYIAPIKIVQKSFAPVNENYARAILRDGYSSIFENVTFAEPNFAEIKKAEDFSYSVREYLDAAKNSGSKYIIAPLIYTKSIKESRERTQRLLIEEIIFDTNGNMLTMNTAGMTTSAVTILDAAFFIQEFLREDRENILAK